MTGRTIALILCAGIAACVFAKSAHAGAGPFLGDPFIVIPTNFGNGADAEIRESQTNVGLDGIAAGNNRGDSSELATRLSLNNQSSSMYMKFDITQLPDSSDTAYWSNKDLAVRVHTRNGGNFRIRGANQNTMVVEDYQLRILALDPLGTYSTSQTDRAGNAYTASEYQYDWNELGITAFNAPGRQPACVVDTGANACSVNDSRGSYEMDFDSNVIDLGLVPMPEFAGNTELPAGFPLVYRDTSGALKQILFDAQSVGEDSVTVIMHNGHTIDDMNTAGTPGNFLGRNHLLVPKEFAADMVENGLDNSAGYYSPSLAVVPEPNSLLLVTLGCLAGLAARRRN